MTTEHDCPFCRCSAEDRAAAADYALANQHRWQAETKPAAHRNGYVWTGPELELVARPDLTARAVANMTGRTMFAVKERRKSIRRLAT